ncbi:heme-binding protein [Reinekea forsetii]|nr:heme-binding protein [Reinekea forsetii]
MDIDLTLSQALIAKALEFAKHKEVEIAVAVVDNHGELVGFARTDNVAKHAIVLAQNKAYTSARDRQKTSSLAQWARETHKGLSYWTDPKFTGIAGGVPIEVKGKVLGAMGVSGLAEADDEALVVEVISACC